MSKPPTELTTPQGSNNPVVSMLPVEFIDTSSIGPKRTRIKSNVSNATTYQRCALHLYSEIFWDDRHSFPSVFLTSTFADPSTSLDLNDSETLELMPFFRNRAPVIKQRSLASVFYISLQCTPTQSRARECNVEHKTHIFYVDQWHFTDNDTSQSVRREAWYFLQKALRADLEISLDWSISTFSFKTGRKS